MGTVLVCGPPGSGKTTYVKERAKPGDLIVDFDAILSAISGQEWYRASADLKPYACEARDAIIFHLKRMLKPDAWIITSSSDPDYVRTLKKATRATLVMLAVPANECLRRIAADTRRVDQLEGWRAVVNQWWVEYRSRPWDEAA